MPYFNSFVKIICNMILFYLNKIHTVFYNMMNQCFSIL